MDKNWVTYWAAPEYRQPLPPATEEQIAGAEETLGVRFPSTLRTMFAERNGGALRGYHNDSTQHHAIRSITADHMGIDRNNPWWLDDEYWQPEPPLELLVPMTGDGHSDLCLDYRRCGPSGEPEVWLIQQEGPETLIATSFDEFLDHIVDVHPTEILSNQSNVEQVADQLAAALGVNVKHFDHFSSVHAKHSLVVRQNRIVRDDLDGEWFRLPEHQVDGVLVQCNLDDGTLDEIAQWRNEQLAIDAAVVAAHQFVTESLSSAGLT